MEKPGPLDAMRLVVQQRLVTATYLYSLVQFTAKEVEAAFVMVVVMAVVAVT